ncbi:SMP-30/gluconolactonase/LRE family protein [Rickettsiella endosymbiont of Dermanyssus gallinae]|uniref:SMP-30/gluconolactonase/LRE family protein n=1 Tax=Rickettsiella endosymbiont of Dermanyssus gallinae TaxID=2856608 RepID=UPI001C52D0DC|nr:SMP-30/gluconolactonase/LRE family protein [Rickettsiella endosymbiont of Dermanyssus gallinae]
MLNPVVVCEEPMLLGESPLWHPEEKCLYWVDIVAASLNRLDINNRSVKKFKMPSQIGSIGWRAKGGLIAALSDRFASIDTETGMTQTIALPLKKQSQDMFNDGKCDRQGRFWAGTKDIAEEKPIGALYCLDTEGKAMEMASGFTVSNGIAWNLDNSRMYMCDSPARQIYEYEFDPIKGRLGAFHVFAQIPESEGFPDGLTVDSEGYIWSCHWDGWQITRYKPTGEIDSIIPMPVPRPTSCCFGGGDLKTLYVTSASVGLSASILDDAPQSGQLFALEIGVKGLAEPAYLG